MFTVKNVYRVFQLWWLVEHTQKVSRVEQTFTIQASFFCVRNA